MEGAGCPVDIRFAPTGVETETEYMTLLMRDKENQKLGGYEKTVSFVRKFHGKVSDGELISAAKIEEPVFLGIISCIAEHPDWDDEDVADWLMEEYD